MGATAAVAALPEVTWLRSPLLLLLLECQAGVMGAFKRPGKALESLSGRVPLCLWQPARQDAFKTLTESQGSNASQDERASLVGVLAKYCWQRRRQWQRAQRGTSAFQPCGC